MRVAGDLLSHSKGNKIWAFGVLFESNSFGSLLAMGPPMTGFCLKCHGGQIKQQLYALIFYCRSSMCVSLESCSLAYQQQ